MKNILLAAIALLFVLASCVAGEAPQSARSWLGRNYPGVDFHVDCMTYDSDGDGYVSCTAVRKDGTGQPIGLECGTGFACNSGCRVSAVR